MAVKNDTATSLFDQAVGTFGDAMKAGVKIQEEIAHWWSGALQQAGQVNQWNDRTRAVLSEAIPAAQKNAEQLTKLVEQNYHRSLELLKLTVNGDGANGTQELQNKTRKLWETSLELIRENTHAMAQTHVKVLELWGDFLRKLSATAAPAVAAAGAKGSK